MDRDLVKPQDYILVECPFSASWNIDRSSFGAPAQFRWGGDTSVKVVFHPFATVPVRSYMMIGFGRAGVDGVRPLVCHPTLLHPMLPRHNPRPQNQPFSFR